MNAKLSSTVFGLLMLATGVPAHADVIWDISGVPNADGVTVGGSFTTDPITDKLLTYDIYVVGGPQNGYLFKTGIPSDIVIQDVPPRSRY